MKKQVQPAYSTVANAQRTWIFQANPKMYRIEESLRVEGEDMWNLRQHHRHVHQADRVLIWISGDKAGIYAVGTVLTEPIITPDSPQGMEYWNDKKQGEQAIARVWVRFDRVLLERPLLRDFLLCDPALWNMTIIRNPRGTNFAVTEAEWLALQTWLEL